MRTDAEHHVDIVLGSRSPQRLSLLRQLLPDADIRVVPAPSEDEAGFDDCRSMEAIVTRLRQIARTKAEAVRSILPTTPVPDLILTGDTVIVGRDADGTPHPLGKPPEQDPQATVRAWFEQLYAGREHLAATAVCLIPATGVPDEFVVQTRVEMEIPSREMLDWYLTTEDAIGKAGGYGLQTLGNLFITRIEGSVSNVIGLPLTETWQAFHRLGLIR